MARGQHKVTTFYRKTLMSVSSPQAQKPMTFRNNARNGNGVTLSTRSKCPNLAMNLAIHYHPVADDILKIDEDIFIGADFVEGLFATKTHAEKYNRHRIGAVSPLLNVNGFSYRLFLEELDLLDAYEDIFFTAHRLRRHPGI